MKKLWMLLALLLLPLSAMAAEQDMGAFYALLPEDMKQALTEEYGTYAVPFGTFLDEEGQWALLALDLPDHDLMVILEKAPEGGCIVAASNGQLIPPHGVTAEQWSITGSIMDGIPSILYQPGDGSQHVQFQLGRLSSGEWQVQNCTFMPADLPDVYQSFYLENNGSAMRVIAYRYSGAVYVPVYVDLSFSAFDPKTVSAYCAHVIAQRDEPSLIPSTMEADALPQGELIAFPPGKSYAVYTGPGLEYSQAGEDGNATVSTDQWIQVFGQEGDWLLIQYNVQPEQNRFGYIPAAALPEGVTVPPLAFERKEGSVERGMLDDDPLRRYGRGYLIDQAARCVQLATMGDHLYYVELTDPDQPRMRGFVRKVDLLENHAGNAFIQVESTPLFADAAGEVQLGTYYGGVEVAVLSEQGDLAQVRVGFGDGHLEGYIRKSDLVFDVLAIDVPYTPVSVELLPGEHTESDGFAAPDTQARRIRYNMSRPMHLMGDLDGFAHLNDWADSRGGKSLFMPTDWVTTVPPYTDPVIIKLTEDSPAYVRPDKSMPGQITLYSGMRLECRPAGDWYYIKDDSLGMETFGNYTTLGYLPKEICTTNLENPSEFPVGMLTPADDAEYRDLRINKTASRGGSRHGWGARFLLMGETESRVLVRTPTGRYGYLDKADITLTGEGRLQRDFGSLAYGETKTTQSTKAYYVPLLAAEGFDLHASHTRVTLLSNMGGGWWNVAVDNRNTFLPEAVLADVPKDVPAYSGIFKDLRDVDFWVVHGYDISSFKMAWNAADAWIVVREDEKPVLAHWVLQGDTWTEAGRVSLLPEHGTWYVGDMKQDMQAEVPWFSVATIWEEEEVNMISTFEQASEGWVLKNVCIGKPEYVDDVGWEVINGRIFTPAEGGLEVTEDGETRFAALDTPVAVEVAAYSATELAAACMAASKVLP